jgi:hypothetical protein
MMHKFLLSICFGIGLNFFAYGEEAVEDSLQMTYHISGAASVTNNGISILPMFTLGKPATIFDLSVGSERLAFEPQFRFSLEGKPWSFIFWFRYKAVNRSRFRFSVGAHPSVAFRTVNLFDAKGKSVSMLGHQQFLATEWVPTYVVNKHLNVGVYFLHAHGFTEGSTNNTYFLNLNAGISNIRLAKDTYLRFNPQLCMLKMDTKTGFYFSETLTLSNSRSPFSISSVVNKKLKSEIAGDDILWNVSLIYSFNKKLKRFI